MADKKYQLAIEVAAKDMASKALGGIGNSLKNLAGIAAGAFAAAKVVDFGKEAVAAASDLSETMSKVGVVFGDQADAVLKFGDTAATAMGMTKNEALAAAGTYGNLFRAMGMTEKVSADMSTSLLGLASDLASFNNMDPSVVLDKLRAGLSGETEPLKSLGVNLTADAVKAKAMAMGIAGTTKELSASAKAQATYALVMEQTSLAQGDFARTSGGLANQQRILAATVGNLKATLGTALLPVVTKVISALAGLATNVMPGVEAAMARIGPLFDGVAFGAQMLFDVLRGTGGDIPWEDMLPPWLADIAYKVSDAFRLVGEAVGSLAGMIRNLFEGDTETAVEYLTEVIGYLLSAFGVADEAIMPTIEAIYDFGRGIMDMGGAALGALGPLMATFKSLGATIMDAFGKLAPVVMNLFGTVFTEQVKTVGAIFKTVFPEIVKIVQTVMGNIQKAIQMAVPVVIKVFEMLGPAVTKAFGIVRNIIAVVVPFVSALIQDMSRFFLEKFGAILSWVTANMPLIQRTITTVLNAIQKIWDTVWPYLAVAIRVVWDIIKVVVETAINAVLGIIKTVMLIINGEWAAAWEALKGVLSTVWEGIKTLLLTLIGGLVTAITGKKGDFLTVGTDFINELWKGVNDRWTQFKTDVINLFTTVKDWLQEHLIGPVTTAFNTLKETLDKVVGWFSTLGDTITGLKDKLPDWLTPGSPTPLEIGIEGIAKALTQVIPLIEDMAAALVSVSDSAPRTDNLPGWMTGFKQMIEAMVAMLGSLYDAPGGAKANAIDLAKRLAEELSGVISVVSDAAAALSSLGDVDLAKLGAEKVDEFIYFIHMLLFQIKEEAATWGATEAAIKDGFALARKMVDQILDLVRIVEPAVGAMTALAEATVEDMQSAAYKWSWVITAVLAICNNLAAIAKNLDISGYPAAALAAEAINKIIVLVEPAVSAITALAGAVLEEIDKAAYKWSWIITGVLVICNNLAAIAGQLDMTGYPAAEKFSESAAKIIGLIQPAIDALAALGEYTPAQNLSETIGMLLIQLSDMLAEINYVAVDWASQGWEAAIKFSDAVGKVVGLIKPAIEALAALAEYTPAAHLSDTVQMLLIQLSDLLAEINYIAVDWASQGWEAAIKFSEAVTKIVGMIKPSIDALLALGEYKSAKALPKAMAAFAADLYEVVRIIVNLCNSFIGEGTDKVDLELVATFATNVQATVGMIKPAIDALASLAKYATAKGLAKAIAAFQGDLSVALQALLVMALGWDDAAVTLVRDFAASVQAITGAISTAIKALVEILGYKGMDARKAMQALETDLNNVLTALARITANLSGAMGVGAANDFRIMAEAITLALNTGLNVITGLSANGAGVSAAAALEAFSKAAIQSMKDALGAVNTGLALILAAFANRNSQLYQAAYTAGQAIGDGIMAGMRSALNVGAGGTSQTVTNNNSNTYNITQTGAAQTPNSLRTTVTALQMAGTA